MTQPYDKASIVANHMSDDSHDRQVRVSHHRLQTRPASRLCALLIRVTFVYIRGT